MVPTRLYSSMLLQIGHNTIFGFLADSNIFKKVKNTTCECFVKKKKQSKLFFRSCYYTYKVKTLMFLWCTQISNFLWVTAKSFTIVYNSGFWGPTRQILISFNIQRKVIRQWPVARVIRVQQQPVAWTETVARLIRFLDHNIWLFLASSLYDIIYIFEKKKCNLYDIT